MSETTSYTAIEAEIEQGRIVAKEPEKLPVQGRGVLIIFPSEQPPQPPVNRRVRVRLPLIPGDDHRINPTPEQLDASLWD